MLTSHLALRPHKVSYDMIWHVMVWIEIMRTRSTEIKSACRPPWAVRWTPHRPQQCRQKPISFSLEALEFVPRWCSLCMLFQLVVSIGRSNECRNEERFLSMLFMATLVYQFTDNKSCGEYRFVLSEAMSAVNGLHFRSCVQLISDRLSVVESFTEITWHDVRGKESIYVPGHNQVVGSI